jgi:hypothetical protein
LNCSTASSRRGSPARPGSPTKSFKGFSAWRVYGPAACATGLNRG